MAGDDRFDGELADDFLPLQGAVSGIDILRKGRVMENNGGFLGISRQRGLQPG